MKKSGNKKQGKYPVNENYPAPPWNNTENKTAEKQRGDKEDFLSPTKIDAYKEKSAIKGSEKQQNLSNGELQKRMEVYDRIGQMWHRYNVVQDIRERYHSNVNKLVDTYVKQGIHYSEGARKGLHHLPSNMRNTIKEMQEQDIRDVADKESRARYKEGENLTKRFKEQQPSAKELKQEFKQTAKKVEPVRER